MKGRSLFALASVALASGGVANAQSGNIVDTAVESRQFPTLVRFVMEADLVQTLSGEGPFTVFAPTEEAFAAVPDGTLNLLLENPESLRNVLLYHVVPGRVTASQVLQAGRIPEAKTALEGATLDIRVVGSSVRIGRATVVATDIMASNGVIHVIDRVLLPNTRFIAPRVDGQAQTQTRGYATAEAPTIVGVAVDSGSFPTLVKLVQEAGLVDVLNSEGPFTVFAPTEEAFAAVPDEVLNALMEDKELLKSVLLYHVVPGKVKAEQVVTMSGQEASTALEGKSLRIRVDGDRVWVGDAQVVQTDIAASNGVIHVINKVLIP